MLSMQTGQERHVLPLVLTECCSPVIGQVTVAEAESLATVLKAIARTNPAAPGVPGCRCRCRSLRL